MFKLGRKCNMSMKQNCFNSIQTRLRKEKTWMSFKEATTRCKEAAIDRTFILPFVIICTLFTFQALSG